VDQVRQLAITALATALFAISWTTPAWGATITDIAADQATVGSQVEIHGTDFGTKPRVSLVSDGATVKARLKVVEVRDGEGDAQVVTVQIVKATAGTYRISVRPRGKGTTPATSSDTLRIVSPRVEIVSPDVIEAGEEFGIGVRWAGTKRGTVLVGGRKAKILSSEPFHGDPEMTVLRLRSSKKTPEGAWEVTYSNSVGSGTAHQGLRVTRSSSSSFGSRRLDATIDGVPIVVKPKWILASAIGDWLHLSATQSKRGESTTLQVVAPFDLWRTATPAAFDGDGVVVVLTETAKDGAVGVWESLSPRDAAVYVNAKAPGRKAIAGSFEGTLRRVHGTAGPETRTVSGRFTIDETRVPECDVHEGIWSYVDSELYTQLSDEWTLDGFEPLSFRSKGIFGRFRSAKALRKGFRNPAEFEVLVDRDFVEEPSLIISDSASIETFTFRTFDGDEYRPVNAPSGRSSIRLDLSATDFFDIRSVRFAGRLRAADGRSKIVVGLICIDLDPR
jgi:hypothetical protein